MKTINFDDGAIEYIDPPVLLTADHDISTDTIEVGLGGWDSVDEWIPSSDPDVLTSRPLNQSVQATLLLGGDRRPAEGDYWLRVRLTDNPEVVPAKSVERVRILNSGVVNWPPV